MGNPEWSGHIRPFWFAELDDGKTVKENEVHWRDLPYDRVKKIGIGIPKVRYLLWRSRSSGKMIAVGNLGNFMAVAQKMCDSFMDDTRKWLVEPIMDPNGDVDLISMEVEDSYAVFQMKEGNYDVFANDSQFWGIIVGVVKNNKGDCDYLRLQTPSMIADRQHDNILNPKLPILHLNLDVFPNVKAIMDGGDSEM